MSSELRYHLAMKKSKTPKAKPGGMGTPLSQDRFTSLAKSAYLCTSRILGVAYPGSRYWEDMSYPAEQAEEAIRHLQNALNLLSKEAD